MEGLFDTSTRPCPRLYPSRPPPPQPWDGAGLSLVVSIGGTQHFNNSPPLAVSYSPPSISGLSKLGSTAGGDPLRERWEWRHIAPPLMHTPTAALPPLQSLPVPTLGRAPRSSRWAASPAPSGPPSRPRPSRTASRALHRAASAASPSSSSSMARRRTARRSTSTRRLSSRLCCRCRGRRRGAPPRRSLRAAPSSPAPHCP